MGVIRRNTVGNGRNKGVCFFADEHGKMSAGREAANGDLFRINSEILCIAAYKLNAANAVSQNGVSVIGLVAVVDYKGRNALFVVRLGNGCAFAVIGQLKVAAARKDDDCTVCAVGEIRAYGCL